ncbi:MAG TPA: hypothetical protein VHL52_03615 [Acidimicrobiia bacterium]|nr:hypothetical protein [Acidimicrobiia bacterium]
MAAGLSPGTVAALHPRPEAVEEAVRLVGAGTERTDAVRGLVESFSADELNAAWLWWVRRMPAESWDDYRPGAVLNLLEVALAEADPLV